MTVQGTTRVAILGSTGSIGTQALEVIAAHPETFTVTGLSAGRNARLLAEQARRFGAALVGIHQRPEHGELADIPGTEILTGPTAAEQVAAASGADVVLNAMTGSIGLKPTLAALRTGARLALANKESLVVGGALVAAACSYPGQITPVDSEHSAIAQALASGRHHRGLCSPHTDGTTEVSRLVLTASGGPFRGWETPALATVTPEQALQHPNFDMGKMVTTNSATMVNKALEVIEAHLLFDVPLKQIDTVVHPQQYIHSMVEFIDGSTLAQAGPPRMLVPIAWALAAPQRLENVDVGLDFTRASQWEFEPLDEQSFGAVRLAKQAASASATHMSVYNAANEQAVHAFHAGALAFTGIVALVEEVLSAHSGLNAQQTDLAAVLGAEEWARATADQLVAQERITA